MKTFGRKPKTSFKTIRMNFAGSKYVASKQRENDLIEKIDNKRITSLTLRKKGEQKMKLKIEFEKKATGQIMAKITVVDQGDYPDAFIFPRILGETIPPSDPSFRLGYNNRRYDCITSPLFNRPQEAIAWAENEVKALKQKLNEWRNIQVPESYTIEI